MNRFLAVILSLLSITSYAQEQAYPVKPIRLLVGYAPVEPLTLWPAALPSNSKKHLDNRWW